MPGKRPKTEPRAGDKQPRLEPGEFRRNADDADERDAPAPSLSDVDWADLPPKLKEKRQRG